jgi:alkylhydroperoxidase family enzyme
MIVDHIVLVSAWAETVGIFSAQERAALAWAEQVTRLGEDGVPNGEFEAAASALDEQQLVDLTLAIALMNAYNRIAISFRGTRMALAG